MRTFSRPSGTYSTLHSGLTARVLAAGVIVLLLDAIACYATASHFANRVYDSWLIDDTRSLAQALRVTNGRLTAELPQVALQIFQFDEWDREEFSIGSERNGYMAGNAALPRLPTPAADGRPLLETRTVGGEPWRIVAMRVAEPAAHDVAIVEVGETLHKRATLATEILIAMAAPQLALLVIALLLSRFAVARGLRPLTTLAAAIEARDQSNLTPVPELDLPYEARVLVSRINELLARLERALAAQRRFVADAAHQLRTPLAALLLFTERAERATDAESRQQALRGLHGVAARAARLVHQLLALARTEPGGPSTQPLASLDLVQLARDVGEEWIPRALEREIDFGFVAPPEPVIIEGHAGLLGELMSNLIDNALRYCGPRSRVTLSIEAAPAPVLAVEDDGPGILPEEREKIFERFYRGREHSGEGCGLGLAIVREIAELHRATAHVNVGRDGRGSRFTVAFPKVRRAA